MSKIVGWVVGWGMVCWVTAGAWAQMPVVDAAVATELLQLDPDFARRYSTSLVEQELAQEAARRGLTERVDVQRALMLARFQILVQALREDVARGVAEPADRDVRTRFERDRAEFRLLEAVRGDVYVLDGTSENVVDVARRIMVAQEIDPELLGQLRYQRVAESNWVAREVFPEEVWTQVRALEPGRVRAFRMPDGNYLLVKYEDYREERAATLDEARDAVREQILAERQQERWDAYVEETRKKLGME